MIRCQAMTFHRRRCRNQVMTVDPKFCHRHSQDHAYRRCLATHSRNGRPCLRKTADGSVFCLHHRPASATAPKERMISGHETGRFRG